MPHTIFDLIADDTRREILAALRGASKTDTDDTGVSVGELVEKLGVSQPTVSKHLKVLRDGGLVSVREVGQHRYYSLSPKPLTEVAKWVAPFVASSVVDEVKNTAKRAGEATEGAAEEFLGSERYAKVAASLGKAGAEVSHAWTVTVDAVSEKVVDPIKRTFSHD